MKTAGKVALLAVLIAVVLMAAYSALGSNAPPMPIALICLISVVVALAIVLLVDWLRARGR
jgi:Flp pilus assembly pilin Flp